VRELAPRAVTGLGATRPAWCPPAEVPRDVCEITYPMDLPVLGVTKVGLPVYRVVYDAMNAAADQLPAVLPELEAAVQPAVDRMVARISDDMARTVEYEVDYLTDKLMREEINPLVEKFTTDAELRASKLVNEILVTTAALSAGVVIAVGVAAWWIKR
jgi:hypothetical protein